ncbi:amino acid adenylation domain-containing protein [Streptomyces goshikiensis]|uniref:amino acid adenylation domain-containing protein n=1 Tax=Streptomyces goshikiensis TaxID=1942 RepID=UPI0036A7D6C5
MRGQHDQNLPLVRADRNGPSPASFSQARLWFADQIGKRGLEFIYPYALRIKGPLDVGALAGALDVVVARHEVLRTTFTSRDGEPLQVVNEPFRLDLPTVSIEPGPEAEAELEQQLRAAVDLPFDLEIGPVLRARLFRLSADEHVFLLVVHHIAIDGWSNDVLFRELTEAYRALRDGEHAQLPDLQVQFADYAAWERERFSAGAYADDLAFWRTHLDGAPHVIGLPLDHERPRLQTFEGRYFSFDVPAAQASPLRQLAESSGTTLSNLLLAAFELLLARWSGQYDFIVGTPAPNRQEPATRDLIGFFMTLLPLRARVDLADSFRRLVSAVDATVSTAHEHQGVSFDRLVEEISPERTLAHNPLIQVTFMLEHEPRLDVPELTCTPRLVHPDVNRYDLALDYFEEPSGDLRFDVYYASDLFENSTIASLTQRYTFLLDAILAQPDIAMSALPVLKAAEEESALARGVGDSLENLPASVLELFEAAVRNAPDARAVIDGETILSFAELDGRSAAIAALLLDRGVPCDGVVGLCLPRSATLVAAILGVLRAGAAYLPLDPAYPVDRLRYMVRESGATSVLTLGAVADADTFDGYTPVVLLDELPSDAEVSPPDVTVHPEQCAYVIFTSGSTGHPKGVQVSHRALTALVTGLAQAGVAREGAGVVGWNASPSFDASVQQWTRVLTGGTLFIVDEAQRRDPETLAATIVRESLTDLDMTPSQATHVIDYLAKELPPQPSSGTPLRLWIGGEALPGDTWQKLGALAEAGTVEAVNVYGTTETTVDSTWARVRAGVPPHLGTALPGQTVRVLDELLQPVPTGVAGELYVSGPTLARGYVNRPGMTASRFLPDPWAGDGSRMYRTGDRARWAADGCLEFLGRSDLQVKVRGYRIELGEVEAALAAFPETLECAVVRKEQHEGDASLAAYVRLTPAGTVQQLREYVQTRMPEWMCPSTYTLVDEMPLTAAGKVDRTVLARIDTNAAPAGHAEPESDGTADAKPLTATEELLTRIWQEVLGVEHVNLDDHFFQSGGHSLLAIRVVARLKRQAQLTIPMTAVFENPVLRDLASYVEQTIRERLTSS